MTEFNLCMARPAESDKVLRAIVLGFTIRDDMMDLQVFGSATASTPFAVAPDYLRADASPTRSTIRYLSTSPRVVVWAEHVIHGIARARFGGAYFRPNFGALGWIPVAPIVNNLLVYKLLKGAGSLLPSFLIINPLERDGGRPVTARDTKRIEPIPCDTITNAEALGNLFDSKILAVVKVAQYLLNRFAVLSFNFNLSLTALCDAATFRGATEDTRGVGQFDLKLSPTNYTRFSHPGLTHMGIIPQRHW